MAPRRALTAEEKEEKNRKLKEKRAQESGGSADEGKEIRRE
jgi:hypothetical protein